jgi:hypothetical protein
VKKRSQDLCSINITSVLIDQEFFIDLGPIVLLIALMKCDGEDKFINSISKES